MAQKQGQRLGRSKQPLPVPPPSPLFTQTAARLQLTDTHVEHLQTYVRLLAKWQPKLNLIGPGTWDDVWNRHVVDSLQCLDHWAQRNNPARGYPTEQSSVQEWPAPRGIADVGAGAGFPGIVVAIVTGQPVTLIESDQRKAAFQLAVKTATGAPLTIRTQRVEALSVQPIDVLLARAFAPLPRLLSWCTPLIDDRTQLILHKGRQALEEVAAAQQTHCFETESFPSLIDSDSVILRLHNIRPAR